MDRMSEREEFLEKSVNAIGLLKREVMADMIKMLQKARDEKANVFVLGNGGSSSTASHFVCDLLKTSIKEGQNRFRAFSLTDNVPVMTAWANDVDYDSIFVEQLKNVIQENDLVIGISCSGNSENVLKAIEYAKSIGVSTIGLTGNSGKLSKITDLPIKVESDNILMIEGVHSVLLHYITEVLRT
jgi:D-sedoheptulose 7-phosphate isomerase|tara:strand:- start:396 stop:950 length:555 start_codon:yes stop_codon:yes gene_type:complete